MIEKIWRYKYRDTVKVTTEDDPELGTIDCRTAEHHPGWNAPIDYDKDGVTCYIYSDKEIPGLELVGENKMLGG